MSPSTSRQPPAPPSSPGRHPLPSALAAAAVAAAILCAVGCGTDAGTPSVADQTIEVDGRTVAYARSGTGPSVVLESGLGAMPLT